MKAVAAVSASVAIAAAAFGAHVARGDAAEWLETGGFYQLVHAVAAIAIGDQAWSRGPVRLLMGGSILFAATLYLMALGMPRWLGAVTPVGGAAMIAGWLWLAVRVRR